MTDEIPLYQKIGSMTHKELGDAIAENIFGYEKLKTYQGIVWGNGRGIDFSITACAIDIDQAFRVVSRMTHLGWAYEVSSGPYEENPRNPNIVQARFGSGKYHRYDDVYDHDYNWFSATPAEAICRAALYAFWSKK
jgi:hypothetical protein